LKVLPVVQDTKLSIPKRSEQDSIKYSIKNRSQVGSHLSFYCTFCGVVLKVSAARAVFYCLEIFSGAPWSRDRPVSRPLPTQI